MLQLQKLFALEQYFIAVEKDWVTSKSRRWKRDTLTSWAKEYHLWEMCVFMGINDSRFRHPNLVQHKVLGKTFSILEWGTLLFYQNSSKNIYYICLKSTNYFLLFYLALFFSSKLSALSSCLRGISLSQSAEIGT